MAKDQMNYSGLVEEALRSVARTVLRQTAKDGLKGEHHFYLSFRTDHARTEVSETLKAQYPEEMTIVLQHQYWGLEVGEEAFEVTLSFNKVHERLHVPFAALTGFYDPSVQFGLQFQGGARPTEVAKLPTVAAPPAKPPVPVENARPPAAKPRRKPARDDKVVSIDQFRKK